MLELLSDSDISILVFRYKSIGVSQENLCALNEFIKKKMFHTGEVLVASTKVNGKFYLKFTILNPLTTLQDIHKILNLIKTYGTAYLNN
jgi:L-2,4-diaminobutyrate decarboxylase